MRGINSIELFWDGKRWWIVTIFWQGEGPDNPLPEKYLRQLMESHAAAERESRWDSLRALARVLGEITLWSLLGLLALGLALHTFDVALGKIYWYTGTIVWIAGVSAAVLSAYRRGENRGDW